MKRNEPKLPAQLTDATEFDPQDGLLTGVRLTGAVADDLAGLDIHACVLERCRLIGCHAAGASFTDVQFRGCDLSNMDCTGAGFVRCTFEDCKAVGLRALDAYLHHVLISGGSFAYANFDAAALKAVELRGVSMPNANFASCKLESVSLTEADLTAVSFFGTPLRGIDLRRANIDGLTAAGKELAGAVVTEYQAAKLARLLGVVVQEL